jgi:hypothetical protein
LATPNYGYEKRQKELAKKRKKEDKLKSKSERKGPGEEDASVEGQMHPLPTKLASPAPTPLRPAPDSNATLLTPGYPRHARSADSRRPVPRADSYCLTQGSPLGAEH